tara:strand:+ start:50 stop:1024 length:975 start_codon:yes stop_codon:yes gene_type:complete
MKDLKSSFFDKIIFYLLNKIFSKSYRTNFSRTFFKNFFGLIRKVIKNKAEISLNKKKTKFLYVNDKLEKFGWVKLIENDLNKNIISLKKNAVESAKRIFDSEFNENRSDKKYLRNINLTNFPKETTSFHEFLTNPIFIKIISKYLNDIPLLTELKLLYSPPSDTKDFKGSQLFHSDFDDEKLVKIFVFIDDIDVDMGPLELIEKNDSKLIMKKVNYSWGQKSKNYSSHDDRLKDVLGKEPTRMELVGSSGSIYLVDTANCLHRGSRNPIKARKVLYANFCTRTSFRNPPLNWIYHNKLTLLKSSPMINLDPKKKLNLGYLENNL